MGRWAVACLSLVALSGCDYFWHLGHVDLSPDAGTSTTDGAMAICTQRAIDDTFTGTDACRPWGTPYQNYSTVGSGNGKLTITPTSSSSGSDGGCDAPTAPFPAGGIIARISDVIEGDSSYTGIQAMGGINAAMIVNGGELWFENYDASDRWGNVLYTGPSEMGWVRLRPDLLHGQIVGEYSGDADHWTTLGMHAATMTDVRPVIVGGVVQGAQYTGIAAFTRFIVCSP